MWGRMWILSAESYGRAAQKQRNIFLMGKSPRRLQRNDSQYEKSWCWVRDINWQIKAVCINTECHSRSSFQHSGLQQPVPLPGTEMHVPSKQRSAPKHAGFALPALYLKELCQPSSRTDAFLMNSVLDWRALGRSCQKVQESLLQLPKGRTEI